MDRSSFYRWFRQTASQLGVPDVSLSFKNLSRTSGELGQYDPGSNTITIDEGQLQDDDSIIHTTLHEFAHALVYKKNSEYLDRRDNKIVYDVNNPLATNALNKLQYHGGHNLQWRQIASSLGVNVVSYVDKDIQDVSPFGQLRRGMGFRH